MNKIIYIIGVIALLLLFGAMMIVPSNESKSVSNVESKNGIQEVRLSLKNYNYYPNEVKVQSGIPVRIYLDSKVIGCLRDFTIRDFGIHKYLKTPEDYVEFTPSEPGRYTFACSMGMGTGVLVVE
jgi:plastocyanin domain-containing protein